MKRLLVIGVLGLASGVCFAVEDTTPQQAITQFGTLNDTDEPITLPDAMAQDLLNVELAEGGRSVKKRKGYALAFTLPVATAAVHGIYNFYDASGNDVSLFFNDRYLTASIGGEAVNTMFSSGTANATWQCTDSLGFAYCASSAREPVIKTNGVIDNALVMPDTGTMVAVTTQRLATAGFSAKPSQINFSGANDFTNWTWGGEVTSPYYETINAPGSRITHIVSACNGLMWFKESSFGIILNPDDALNAQIVVLAPEIGTLDNTSVQYPGGVQFRAQDGHIINFDCSGIEKLTKDIQTTIGGTVAGQNSWSSSVQSDFTSGIFDNTSATISPGDVVLSTNNVNIDNGTFGSGTYAESRSSWTWLRADTAESVPGTDCNITPQSAGWLVMTSTTDGFAPAFNVSVVDCDSFEILVTTGIVFFGNSCAWKQHTISYFSAAGGNAAAMVHRSVRIKLSEPVSGYTAAYSNCFSNSGALTTFYSASNRTDATHIRAALDTFEGGSTTVSTGTYTSPVYSGATGMSVWDRFHPTYVDDGGTHAFFIRASPTLFTVGSSTPAWASISADAIPMTSTGAYIQWKDSFTITAATQTPTLNSVTQYWAEGTTALDKAYGVYFGKDNAIWWSVPYESTAGINNRILRWDLINRGWLVYDIPANGFLIRNQNLYFGSATAGKIYKFGEADADDGAAINSYWKSKDFAGGNPLSDKEFRTLSVVGKSVQGSTLDVTYTVNGSSPTTYSLSLYDSASTLLRNNRYLPAGRVGNTFSIQVGNNAAEQFWEVYGASFGFVPKPWQVTP